MNKMISIYILQLFDDIAQKSIIFECIAHATNESLVLECMTTNQLVQCIRNELSTSITCTGHEYNLLFQGERTQIMDYLQIFGNYLHGIEQMISNCDQIGQSLRNNFTENPALVEHLLNFIRNVSTLNHSTNIPARGNWCVIKLQFASKLFSLIFDLYEPIFFLKQMDHINSLKIPYDRCITSHLIAFITLKPVN